MWLVIPAWGRVVVTRLALTAHTWLADELEPAGIDLRVVMVADDGNVEVAREFGWDTLEHRNMLGGKINAGFAYALDHGADYAAFIGSDDWLHPGLFTALDGDRVVAGHNITVVDLIGPRLRRLGWRAVTGVPPWFLPRTVLERTRGRLVDPDATRGMEGEIASRCGVNPAHWLMHDPFPDARVDFKSHVGMSSFDMVSRACGVGATVRDPWPVLEARYPADLVELARETSDSYEWVAA